MNEELYKIYGVISVQRFKESISPIKLIIKFDDGTEYTKYFDYTTSDSKLIFYLNDYIENRYILKQRKEKIVNLLSKINKS
jgi:hypothetical protein